MATKTSTRKTVETEAGQTPRLPLTLTLAEAAQMLGIGKSTAWAIYRRHEFPIPVLKIGGNLRVLRGHLEIFMVTGVPVEPGTPIDAFSSEMASA